MYLKAEKYTFHQASTHFLKYHISAEGIKMDKWKVEAMWSWPIPAIIKVYQELQLHYSQFIKKYSSITAPLTSLLKSKHKSLSWSQDGTHAIQWLKCAFTTAPLLVHPDPEKPFVVELDASTTDVGAVLSQQ